MTSSSSSTSSSNLLVSGDLLTIDQSSLVGHGLIPIQIPTSSYNITTNTVQSTVSGQIQRVNKLISISALHHRYVGEIGDIVVGRIIDVGDKRWKVDVHSQHYA